MDWIGYIASVCVGVVLGLLGGGGSILSIPILVYLFKLDVVTASAYSLFIVGVTSLVGAIPKYKEQLIDLRTGLLFGIPSIVSIFCTRKWIIPAIPEFLQIGDFEITRRFLLLGIFSLLMILASYSMIRKREITVQEFENPKNGLVIIQGLLIGFLTGLVGAGGGFLIIPALVLLTGLPFKTAVGTSLLIIAINSLLGFAGDVLNHAIDWRFLLVITSLATAGIFIGNYLSGKILSVKLRQAFGWFVLASGLYILIREASSL
jgi:uncharacterized membrane protein YfcA